jgi:hypothetical protein
LLWHVLGDCIGNAIRVQDCERTLRADWLPRERHGRPIRWGHLTMMRLIFRTPGVFRAFQTCLAAVLVCSELPFAPATGRAIWAADGAKDASAAAANSSKGSNAAATPSGVSKPAKALSKKWTVLHQPGKAKPNVAPLPKNSTLEVLKDFELQGPRPGDPFLFGNFKSQGEWGLVNGTLKPLDGKHTACKLARADSFELEGVINAEGLGGWFFLLGWDKDNGYMIYNVNLRVSGSPWLVVEFREAKGIEETHREFHRYEWKGDQPFSMTLEGKELSIIAGREVVAQKLPLPNYRAGDVIVGTYDTRYGPKPLAIQSLRIRAK